MARTAKSADTSSENLGAAHRAGDIDLAELNARAAAAGAAAVRQSNGGADLEAITVADVAGESTPST